MENDSVDNPFPEELWRRSSFSDWGSGFWAEARVQIISKELRRLGVSAILDVGSGNGALVSIPLSKLGISVTCVEPLSAGASKTLAQGIPTVISTLSEADLPAGSFPAVGLFDVLEYVGNEEEFLREVIRITRPGGIVMISVPAHRWLFSDYDVAVGNRRRYSRLDLVRLLEISGFEVLKLSGVFSMLVPFAFLHRRLPYMLGISRPREFHGSVATRASKIPKSLAALLLLSAQVDFWFRSLFGLSLFAVARKTGKTLLSSERE